MDVWSTLGHYVDYSKHAIEHICHVLGIFVQGTYASNVEIHVYHCSWSHCSLQGVHMRYIYWHGCFICGTYMTFKGHICCWNIYVYNMVNEAAMCCHVLTYMYSNMGLNVDYILVQWDIHVWCERHIYSGAFATNVKFMYTSTCGHIVNCSELMWYIYTDLVVWYLHIN